MAHEWTPTYPKLEPSYVPGVLRAEMKLFNSRKDVNYYKVQVFDNDWKSVPFATESDIIKIKHLQRKLVTVYIRQQDKARVVYICSKSKLVDDFKQTTVVSSRICSKIK